MLLGIVSEEDRSRGSIGGSEALTIRMSIDALEEDPSPALADCWAAYVEERVARR